MKTEAMKQWEVQSSTGKHFDVLDGIRGIAILMVVALHTFYVNPKSGLALRTIRDLIGTGWIGVPIFFVLSGFLISYPFFRGRATDLRLWYPEGYTRRRVGKILPPYYLSIAVFALYYLVRFTDPIYLHAAFQWAIGLPNFVPSTVTFNMSYWSLLIEAHFYAVLPLLFFLTRGLNPRPTAVILFLILFVVPLIARQLTWPQHTPEKTEIAFLMARFPCQLDFFAWGVLFSGVFASLSGPRDGLRALGLFGYAGLVLLIVSVWFTAFWSRVFDLTTHPARWSTEMFHLMPGASAFLLLFFVFDPTCVGARLLAHPWLRFIGLVSYEWFLFHQPVVYFFWDMVGDTRGSLLSYLVKTTLPLTLTFGLSVLVYRCFSLPLMNKIRGKRSKRGPGIATAEVQPLCETPGDTTKQATPRSNKV